MSLDTLLGKKTPPEDALLGGLKEIAQHVKTRDDKNAERFGEVAQLLRQGQRDSLTTRLQSIEPSPPEALTKHLNKISPQKTEPVDSP